jgi:hypothetical protein
MAADPPQPQSAEPLDTGPSAPAPEASSSPAPAPPLTWVPPGHFYSPLADPGDPHVLRTLENFPTVDLPPAEDLRIDDVAMLALFRRLSRHYPALPFAEQAQPGLRYRYENPAFSYTDAIVLFCMLMEFRPGRLVEVGSGHSSCVTMDTNDRFFDGRIQTTFIDPYPETLESLLPPEDTYRARIFPEPLQNAPLQLFTALGPNDILFIDSSHVSKCASDVNDYMFRILPSLKPGVIVHIHDIFYPFDYGAAWIRDENRSWNEAYLLRAFLQYNTRFEILYFNDYIYRKHANHLKESMPLCLRNSGGSIWLQKSGPDFATHARSRGPDFATRARSFVQRILRRPQSYGRA